MAAKKLRMGGRCVELVGYYGKVPPPHTVDIPLVEYNRLKNMAMAYGELMVHINRDEIARTKYIKTTETVKDYDYGKMQ